MAARVRGRNSQTNSAMLISAFEAARPLLVVVTFSTLIGALTFIVHALVGVGWRVALLQASVVFGLLIWAISEALGALHALTTAGLLACWGLVAFAVAMAVVRQFPAKNVRPFRQEMLRLGTAALSLPRSVRLILGFLALLAGALAVTALLAAPNTWDSMTYHLSRVMHWQQNRSLEFYATNIQRQLAFGPWAEMAILHLQILSGGDRLANSLQFFALIGCAIGMSVLASQLGGDGRAQALVALLCATMPIAILQGTSTQNDLVTAFWCTAFVVFLLLGRTASRPGFLALLTGVAAGLAILTKVTALLYLSPFAVWCTVASMQGFRWRASRRLLTIAGVALLVLLPHWLRTYSLYGNVLGVAKGPELSGYTNEVISIGSLTSNTLRNASLQLGVPWQPLNLGIQNLVRAAHALLGLDINDPRTTWQDSRFEIVFSMFEDNAGNPLHVVLAIAGLFVLIRFRSSSLAAFALCALSAFLLFCLVLKWQPWNNRLLLPILMIVMVPVGVLISRLLPGDWILAPAVVLSLVAIPYLISNPTRPLLGERSILLVDRRLQYFANVPDKPETYIEAARRIRGAACDRIGLASPPEGREYLLWVTNQTYKRPIRVEHILVKNTSRRYGAEFKPCAVVVTYPYADSSLRLEDVNFQRVFSTDRFSLFLAEGDAP